jgi:hypothetical protein
VLGKVRTPTVLILAANDPHDPDPVKRGAMAEKHFSEAEIAHLVIAKPPGFTGHHAAWLPLLDYAYGRCIEAFIASPATKACLPPSLSNRDFRSILSLTQVAGAETKTIASADPLAGKKFVVYALATSVMHHYDYVSATQRKHTRSSGIKSEGVAFRDGLHCVGGRCSKLLRGALDSSWSSGPRVESSLPGGWNSHERTQTGIHCDRGGRIRGDCRSLVGCWRWPRRHRCRSVPRPLPGRRRWLRSPGAAWWRRLRCAGCRRRRR